MGSKKERETKGEGHSHRFTWPAGIWAAVVEEASRTRRTVPAMMFLVVEKGLAALAAEEAKTPTDATARKRGPK